KCQSVPTIHASPAPPTAWMGSCRSSWIFSTRTASWSARLPTEPQRKAESPGEIDPSDLPVYCRTPTLVLGIGNLLFGDDGFGCAVVDYLEAHYQVPEAVCLLDAGTGVRSLLFTLCLSPARPQRLLILDAISVQAGSPPKVMASSFRALSCCSRVKPSTRQRIWYLPSDVERTAFGGGTASEARSEVRRASPSVSKSRYRCRTAAMHSLVRLRLAGRSGLAAT